MLPVEPRRDVSETGHVEERRSGSVYVLIKRSDLDDAIAVAGRAGGEAAVESLLTRWSKQTKRNLAWLGTLLVAVFSTWIVQLLGHIQWVP